MCTIQYTMVQQRHVGLAWDWQQNLLGSTCNMKGAARMGGAHPLLVILQRGLDVVHLLRQLQEGAAAANHDALLHCCLRGHGRLMCMLVAPYCNHIGIATGSTAAADRAQGQTAAASLLHG